MWELNNMQCAWFSSCILLLFSCCRSRKCMCNIYVWLVIFLYFLVASYNSFNLIILSVYTNWFFEHTFSARQNHGLEWNTHFIIQVHRIASAIWIIVIDWRHVCGVMRTNVLAVIRWRSGEWKNDGHKLEILVLWINNTKIQGGLPATTHWGTQKKL